MAKIISVFSLSVVVVLLLVLGGTLVVAAGLQPEADPTALHSPGSAFTYQGYLTQSNEAANGDFDLVCSLHDDPEAGAQVGPTVSTTVTVVDGLFTTELDFGSVFNGAPLWLEIGVRPAGQTEPHTPLLPRQRLTPVPYAVYASLAASASWEGLVDLPSGFADNVDDDTEYLAGSGLDLTGTTFALSTTYQLPQTCATGETVKWDGSSWACGTDELGGGGSAWLLTGNAGTSSATEFVGTTDDQALELRVNNSRALRLEPDGMSPNVLGGYAGNSAETDVHGATIGGGGGDLAINQVAASYGTVGGGVANRVDGYAASIGGGASNAANANYAAIGGGQDNVVTGTHATVAGGLSNVASGVYATVGGGVSNVVSDTFATVSGGMGNEGTAAHASVGGGSYNSVRAAYGTISGGGPSNTDNPTTTNNRVYDEYGTIGGGGGNEAGDADAASQPFATVGGGQTNAATGSYTTIGGGFGNSASGYAAAVAGGASNNASANYTAIGGGQSNQVSADYGMVGGGAYNVVAATYGTIPGGVQNQVGGLFAFAAGRQAHAEHTGTFVWSDSSSTFASTAAGQFLIDASGGVGIGTDSPTEMLVVQGNGLFLGGDEPVARGSYTSSWRLLDSPSAVYATGSGVYVTSYSTNTLAIFDTSDPDNIEHIGYSTSNLAGPSDVFVTGQRAFVVSTSNNRLVVFDLSDPSEPDSLGSTDEGLSNPLALYLAGKYAYVAANGLAIFDISDPAHIQLKDFTSTYLLGATDVFVAGTYAYVTSEFNHRLAVYDISDPRPGQIVPMSFATGSFLTPRAVFVSGLYAYVVAEGSNELIIFDVSDPKNIVLVGSTTTNLSAPRDVIVADDLAYVASSGNDRLAIFDISDPTDILAKGYAGTGEGSKPVSLSMTGKHVYVACETADKLSIYDVNHLQTPNLQTGNLQTAGLNVIDNAAIENDLAVLGGLQVGQGGALIGGALSVTGQDDSHILGALSVGGAGALISDTVHVTRSQWITAPTHALDVIGEGRFRVNDYHSLVLRSPNAGSDEDAYIDLIRSSQTSVFSPSARIEFDAADPFTHTTSIHFHTQGPGDPTLISRLQVSAEGHLLPDSYGDLLLGDQDHPWAEVHALGGVVTTSDGRHKHDVTTLPHGLAEVSALRPVAFTWADGPDDGTHYGLIAQEVREVLPDLVSGDDGAGGALGLNYGELVPVLVKAIQEQQNEIDTQAEQITALEARLTSLEDGQSRHPGVVNPFTTLGFGGLLLGVVALGGLRRRGRRL
jgi:hypothetical protein